MSPESHLQSPVSSDENGGAVQLTASSASARDSTLTSRSSAGPTRSWTLRVLDGLIHPPDLGILAATIVVLSVVLWWVQVQAFYSYHTFAQDLGAYNQALYNTAYSHAFLYYTTQIQGKNTGALLSIHFSPILALLAPAYWVAPGPTTLLLLKQLIVESAAVPLYLLARQQLKSRAFAALFAAGYLAAAPVMALTWTTFDPEVFLPVTVIGAFYFQAERRWIGFIAFLIAALCVIESAGPLIATYFAVGLVGEYWWQPASNSPSVRKLDRRFLLVGLIVCIAGFAVSWIDLNLVYDTGGGFGAAYARHFYTLGAQSIPGVPLQVITHPARAVQAVAFDLSAKLLYAVLIFGTVGFLAFFARLRFLAPAGCWLVLVFLSSVPGWFEIGNQYAGYLIPFVFAGAIDGAPRLAHFVLQLHTGTSGPESLPSRRVRRVAVLSVAGCFLIGVVCVAAVSSPLTANPVGATGNISFGWNVIGDHEQQIDSVIALVPPSASILTTSHLFPQVSDRLNAYLLPLGQVGFAPGRTFGGFVQQLVNQSQFILIDFQVDPIPAQTLLQFADFPGGISSFGLRAAVAGTYLLERGWTGPPQLWVPFTTTAQAADFAPNGAARLQASNLSQFSGTIYWPAGGQVGSSMWTGPTSLPTGFGLPPGNYTATFHVFAKSGSAGLAAKLRVIGAPATFAAIPFVQNSAGTHYNVNFTIAGPMNRLSLVNYTIDFPTPSKAWVDETGSVNFQFFSDMKLFLIGTSQSTSQQTVLYGVSLVQTSAAVEWTVA